MNVKKPLVERKYDPSNTLGMVVLLQILAVFEENKS